MPPVTEWDFVGRRDAGPVPRRVVAAIQAALAAYLRSETRPGSADPVIPWCLAGRREAVGEPAIQTRSELLGRVLGKPS